MTPDRELQLRKQAANEDALAAELAELESAAVVFRKIGLSPAQAVLIAEVRDEHRLACRARVLLAEWERGR